MERLGKVVDHENVVEFDFAKNLEALLCNEFVNIQKHSIKLTDVPELLTHTSNKTVLQMTSFNHTFNYLHDQF
jgi:hypothetical protein